MIWPFIEMHHWVRSLIHPPLAESTTPLLPASGLRSSASPERTAEVTQHVGRCPRMLSAEWTLTAHDPLLRRLQQRPANSHALRPST